MKTKTVQTWEAKIYVGFLDNNKKDFYTKSLVNYLQRCEDYKQSKEKVHTICYDYCSKVGLCVTMTDTQFIYKNGEEPGCIIGLIQYPRFPDTLENLTKKALELGELLRKALSQKKVSVVFPDETVMLYDGEL